MAKEEVGHALFRLNSTLRRFIDSNTHNREHEPLNGPSMWLLRFLAENRDAAVYMKDVEKRFGLTRSTASKTVDLLVRNGLIERRTDEKDMRLRRLILTRRAESLLEDICRDHMLVESTLTQGFAEEEKIQVLHYLERMRENIDNAASRRQKTERSESSLD